MSQKERSYWECAIKLSTKPSKPKNRTWIFPKTKDEENWWHDYTKKKLTQEETKFWSKTYVHFNFLLYSCVVGFVSLCEDCVICKRWTYLSCVVCFVCLYEGCVICKCLKIFFLVSEVLWKIFHFENIILL